uniref:Chromosome 14 open reading frame 93 n=1 Tax=Catagonus wagneri TaxID=51154 RepID=A0A8C3YR02_9CETA
MSFSATILFSPPGSSGGEARCCCCACKSETSGGSTGCQGGNPPPSTPIMVTGHGLAIQSSEQLLHVIYQRVEKAVGLAEAALGLARANNELLKRLQEEVGELRQGKVPAPDEDGESQAHSSPPEEPGPLKESPGEAGRAVSAAEEECDSVGSGVQMVIEELRQLGAASAGGPGPLSLPAAAAQRDVRPPGSTVAAADGPPMLNPLVDDYVASDGAVQWVLVPAYAKQLSPATQLAIQRATSDTGLENGSKPPPPRPEDTLSAAAALEGALEESGPAGTGELRHSVGFTASPCRTRGSGQKNSRRKRDLVLSKLVHNVHNHITNDKRFNGSESIKSFWNISVVKFLLEKLKQELVTSPHNYTDKELKGACVAYFLTKRREYRNSLNPFKGLKEKEEKKLRSRRYRLFANRSSIMRHFGPEDQHLWKDVTEELMSDEEDSLNEPGVWVARPPRFRAQRLTQLCYHLDANSKHGTKANRVYGPPSDRLPSAEAQLLPPELYNPNFQDEEDEGGDENGPAFPSFDQPHKTCCPDLNSFVEIKVEKDE